MYNISKRIIWVDVVKIFACILVVLGHLHMSMMSSNYYAKDAIYYWFPIQTIYTFHVPLFFVCSGYLYQMKSFSGNIIDDHIKTIKSKGLNLIIPYVFFSLVTLVLKVVFSTEVNNQATPIIDTILFNPVAPYWFLYALFFLFCVIPRFKNKRYIGIFFALSIFIKYIYIINPSLIKILPYAIRMIIMNSSWFLFGMLLTNYSLCVSRRNKMIFSFILFIAIILSFIFYQQENKDMLWQMIIGWLFVIDIIGLVQLKKWNKFENIIGRLSKYFLPIFLMHTIFAAGIRIIMFKLGIFTFSIHILVGIVFSFIVPIIVYEILKKKWGALFLIEPSKALKIRRKINENN